MGLMDQTYSYEQLQNKYDNFIVPAAKLLVGGADILGLKEIAVHNISIRLSLDSAGSASFSMNGNYDYKNGSFDAALKSKTVLGKEVEVKLGYGSALTTVFKGFLVSTNINFSEDTGIAYEVTAMDARRLMMSDNRHSRNHTVNNYSDAVKTILGRYSKLCGAEVEATQDKLEGAVIAQNGSDYDFITKELIGSGKVEREFFIVGDKAYFRRPKGSGTVMMTLGLGKGIKSFSRSASYLNQELLFVGKEEGSGKSLTGSAKAKSQSQQVNALFDAGLIVESAPDCHSAGELKKRAENRAQELEDASMQASVTCVGLPELVPGRFVKIDRVDPGVNGKYYVTGVSHSYSQGGFTTSMEMKGWK